MSISTRPPVPLPGPSQRMGRCFRGDRLLTVSALRSGQTSSLTLDGTATHEGGSCQISLSFDGGKSFKGVSDNGPLPFISEAHRLFSRQGVCLSPFQLVPHNNG